MPAVSGEIGYDVDVAIHRWYSGIQEKLVFFAISAGVPRMDVEDVVQEAVYRALKSKNVFFSPNHLRRYLSSTITRLSIDMSNNKLRKLGILNMSDVPDHDRVDDKPYIDSPIESALLMYGENTELDPLKLLLNNEMSDIVTQALSRLSESYRVLLILVHVDGLDYATAAKRVSLPQTTVRSRLSKAKKALRIEIARIEQANIVNSRGRSAPLNR